MIIGKNFNLMRGSEKCWDQKEKRNVKNVGVGVNIARSTYVGFVQTALRNK